MSFGFLEMSKVVGTARLAFAALFVLLSSFPARGEEATRTRVTIRGSGTNVTIEQTQLPGRRPVFERKVAPDPLGDAIQLKTEGLDDSRLLAYLRAHEAEIPPVIGTAVMTRLRRAGAGKAVVAYLATVAAVDVGETGEGREPAVSTAPLPATEAVFPVYGMPYGYPLAGGYATPYPARRRAPGFLFRRAPFPRGQPLLRRSLPMRPSHGRRLFN